MKSWGSAPSIVNGIHSEIRWKSGGKKLSVWALNENGQRKTQVPVTGDANGVQIFHIGPEYQTVWYDLQFL